MHLEKVHFAGSHGQRLGGRIEWPSGAPRGLAVFAHCFSCGKDIKAAARIAHALAARGIAVMRFDFTGLGESEGEFAPGFTADIADLVTAAAYLRSRAEGPLLMIGHSLGGTATLAAAAEMPNVVAAVAIAAPFSPDHVLHNFSDRLDAIASEGRAEVKLGGRPFHISQAFVDDVRMHDQAVRLATFAPPLLLLYAPDDKVVPAAETRRIFDTVPGVKSLVALDGADHLMSGTAVPDYAAAIIGAWAERYLLPVAPVVEAMPDAGVVALVETGEGMFQQRVWAGGRSFLADEPVAVGGLASGPSPYDLLAAALGACTAMTLRLYANRKGLPLGPIRTWVRHDKIHATDCAACETKAGHIDQLSVELDLPGDLTPEQRTRLLEIADMCPVHRTLQSEVALPVRLHNLPA